MRIVTYNTRGSLGMDGSRNTRRIADTIRPLAADIICFQEIHNRLPWSRERQPEMLEDYLGRRFVFQANLHVGMGGYGLGVCTRLEIVATSQHLLPGGGEQRGVLEVRVASAGGPRPLTVFCTHLALNASDRLLQAAEIAGLVRRTRGPVVVCGDFNEAANAPAVESLCALGGLMAAAPAGQPTYPSDTPDASIDLILTSRDLRCDRFEVVRSLASDHLPVAADLSEECFT